MPRIPRLPHGSQHARHAPQAALLLAMAAMAAMASAQAAPPPASSLEVELDQRTRVEWLDGTTRAGARGQDHQTDLRTGLRLHAQGERFFATLDVVDARAIWQAQDTRINSGVVNTLEPVEALIGLTWQGDDAQGRMRLGRQTLDLGSRRLVARNAWRNTTNAFVGADAAWRYESGTELNLFAYAPLTRLPADPDALRDGQWEWDDASSDQRFIGAFAATGGGRDRLEGYLFHLDEDDTPNDATRNRRLWTIGGRVLREPAAGHWDWELEAALQTGTSRASSAASDQNDLDHFAHFQHIEAGYTFAISTTPRLSLEIDHATGDEDPADGDNDRFDHLFGAALADMSYRGLYFAFARTNVLLVGPALRFRLPGHLSANLRIRSAWLAESADLWFPTGLGNRAGGVDRHLGIESYARLAWQPPELPFTVSLGAARLDKGDFSDAPDIGPAGEGPALYGYAEIHCRLP